MDQTPKRVKVILTASLAVATLITGYLFLMQSKEEFPLVSLFETCSIDNISGAIKEENIWKASTDSPLMFQGWAADAKKSTQPDNIVLQLIDIDNNVVESWISNYETARLDVAGVFKNPAMEISGFNLRIGTIPTPGLFKVQLGSVNANQKQICTFSSQLLIE